ncbi:hypothetical protein BJ138DRAFT_1118703 [Hygrophoropsis aurantiaca]|uniref:Uncharacterized protein n=1 Tax=Hygrophoropsis aurantiaca TaxID=72124 RepID=A0ACB7ZWV9_9AGAM|nr:hypothetical protein BJ138DRAFT_1118703 [Hygrophoropsis aurantiaca]
MVQTPSSSVAEDAPPSARQEQDTMNVLLSLLNTITLDDDAADVLRTAVQSRTVGASGHLSDDASVSISDTDTPSSSSASTISLSSDIATDSPDVSVTHSTPVTPATLPQATAHDQNSTMVVALQTLLSVAQAMPVAPPTQAIPAVATAPQVPPVAAAPQVPPVAAAPQVPLPPAIGHFMVSYGDVDYYVPFANALPPFYLVTRGRRIGVFSQWQRTAPYVIGVGGAAFSRIRGIENGRQMMEDGIDSDEVVVLP